MIRLIKPLVYITRKIPEYLLKPYENQLSFRMWEDEEKPVPREVMLNEIKHANGMLCLITEKIDHDFIKSASHLKIIANMAVGYDNIDVSVAKKHQIIVTNTPDVLTETTADLTFSLLMATARRLIEASDLIRKDQWGDWSPFMLAGTDIHRQTIGIVGMGRIGEAVARRAKGFAMNILYHNRNRKPEVEDELGASYVSFQELLEKSDFVVSLVPLSAKTNKMFNQQAFKTMKSTAIFINVSRGGVVDELSLVEALKSGDIKAAGLDVFAEEPIASDHPFVNLPNVVCLPHIGSASKTTRENMLKLCLDNLSAVLTGGEPLTPVK